MKKKIWISLIAMLTVGGVTSACSTNNSNSSLASTSSIIKRHRQVRRRKAHRAVRLNIRVKRKTLNATLNNSSAAKAFAKELPKTMKFRDFMSGYPEKIADLHHTLPTKGMPSGHEGTKGAIGYWSPDRRIVFYYGTEEYYEGIHIIGKFTSKNYASVIKNMGNNVNVKITRVNK